MNQSSAVSRSKKSTNVRSENGALRAYRLGFRLLGAGSTTLASRYAERLFFTARRHPRPAWEHELLDRAKRLFVAHEQGFLPVWSWGEGPTVLLVHGWEGRGAQLGAFVDPLVEAGFRVATFDGPGHGDAEPTRASVPDMAIAIGAVAAAVGPLHGLVAHSMGALASTLALSRHVTARRAVFLAPATDPREYASNFGRVLGLDPSVVTAMVARIERRFGLRLDDLYAPSIAARLDLPLRVIHDVTDREVPVSSGRALVEAWPGAVIRETDGLGHRRILRDVSVVSDTVAFVADRPGVRTSASEPRVFAPEIATLGLRG